MITLYLYLLATVGTGSGLENGLARTPPMGWMSWAAFMCQTDCLSHPRHCISEDLFREMADRIVEDGFLAAGYNGIHIDDCWMERQRSSRGELVPDRKRFPSGMKNLAKYMHDRKLQLGIYENFGKTTCMGFPGSIDHLEIDAKTFASWDVDYLKMDGCFTKISLMGEGYPKMERALNATGRPIVYSCSWPFYVGYGGHKVDFTPVRKSCNLWRVFVDVEGTWNSIANIVNYVNANQDTLAAAQRPGAWNDMDMIVAGLGNLTPDQVAVQMTLWSVWSSPLIMSNDLRELKPELRNILLNRDVIAVDQDALGIMGKLVHKYDSVGVYVKPVTPVINGLTSFVVAVVNMATDREKKVQFSLASLGLVNIGGYMLRNLWTGEELGRVYTSYVYRVTLKPTSASMIKLTLL